MDRNREARRATMTASNGLPRRRHRTSLRDSPEEDGPVELGETARLRDRGSSGKKDRDRDRDRERDRDRDRFSRSGKRRRGDRLMLNREDGGEESSEESVNDEDEEDEDDGSGSGHHVRILPPSSQANSLSSSSAAAALNNHARRSFPPAAKVFRTTPWKAADEMIGVSVPRKARSASTKRSHEWVSASGHLVGGDQILGQASTSPVRPSLAATTASPVRPLSPFSSSASARKKLKPNGPKQRPPKSSSKSTSSAQDEIEIEIAEVLYGMGRQSQGPSKNEALGSDLVKFDSREENNSTGDAKSRISSPISNSQSGAPLSSVLPQNSGSSAPPPLTAIAPKRKKPRPVKYEDETPPMFPVRSSPISSTKAEVDQKAKIEAASPNMEKALGFTGEENGASVDLAKSQPAPVSLENQPEPMKLEGFPALDSKLLTEEPESRDATTAKEEPPSPKKESSGLQLDDDRVDKTATKSNCGNPEIEKQREEKFQIDLMAPPPSRSSPERDGDIDFPAVDPKSMVSNMRTPLSRDDEKTTTKVGKEEAVNAEAEAVKAMAVDAESHKPVVHKVKNIDLQLDLEKADGGAGSASVNKLNQPVHKQQQQSLTEKSAQTPNSLTFPMSVAGWPGGLPPMGYMGPLGGVVSMDGSTVASAAIQPPQLLFSQPRPKRCATHCYIARNINFHQQFTRINPFWPAAAGSASLYGTKPCNLSVVPSPELHGNLTSARNMNALPEKGQNLAIFPGKEKASQSANSIDAPQRKQILLQQTLPPGAPSNILHGPALFFPLSQQHAAAAAAASVRPGPAKSPNVGGAASAGASTSTSSGNSAAAAATATAMSFNYPNMPGGETQYLAILQNNAYPFPVPTHVGAAPAYRGSHAQAMPFFNGSFYPSQMLHPSQLQQQSPAQLPQSQQGHPNTSISSSSSSTQKHLQNQQQRPHSSNGNLPGYPSAKTQQAQQLQLQHNQHAPHQVRALESEGGEDSPSTADSRVARANMSIYSQNFTLPITTGNFALMTPAQLGAANGTSSTPGEKKQQQQQQLLPQQQGPKSGMESLPSQAFAMSFSSINSSASAHGLDIITQNHAILQSIPEANRHNYQIMAAAQQKKNHRASDEGRTGGNDASNEDERKPLAGKTPATIGQSIAFSRPDLADTSVSALPGSNVVDSSARTLNLGSAAARTSGSVIPAVVSTLSGPTSQQQLQRNQQQQQMIQLHKQQQFAAAAVAAARSKSPVTSNGSVYVDHLPPSSAAASKFPSSLSSFSQNLIQTGSAQSQSTQWKGSIRPATSHVPSSLTTTSTSSLKNLPQQQGRTAQGQTHISFAANSKSPNALQGQQIPNSSQSPSSPVVVGSPTTSMSKSAGGSPRTATSSSTGNKSAQASSLQAQVKNPSSVPSRKSSPVGTGNVPSILGSSQVTSSSSGGTKHPQQLPKQPLQQAHQLFFSHPYVQVQPPHSTNSTSTASAANAYYHQRRPPDQQSKSQQPQGSAATSSSGMLSLCTPITLANASTCDPVKAVAASNNMKGGGGLPTQSILHAAQFTVAQPSGSPHQLVPAGFQYIHPVPNAVQVKPAEQKQPAAREEV
ncbi:protein TIME FOR COFFEE isoform X2 [Rhodamnia argentea]|uniref:Protein TIME FOR COFFEE isoform X2 n=1 Tax=Rhodamnia argentea TaxID=178133 RepID=A0A8B8QLR6_9MYRT|nr:protein TIME FOR COFFEE isoform X2 [Rhodamnia argentea]